MGMTEEFETSLQVLRGFDTDITTEVNEIKVNTHNKFNELVFPNCQLLVLFLHEEPWKVCLSLTLPHHQFK